MLIELKANDAAMSQDEDEEKKNGEYADHLHEQAGTGQDKK